MSHEIDSQKAKQNDFEVKPPYESFEGTASFLGIPEENWKNPAIREFVNVLNIASRLQTESKIAEAHSFLTNVSDPEQIRAYNSLRLDLNPSLSQRYSSTELLARAIKHILESGVSGGVIDPNYIQDKVDAAIRVFGLSVEKRNEE